MRKIAADENFTTILEYYYFLQEITIDTNYVQSIHVICLLSLRIVPFFLSRLCVDHKFQCHCWEASDWP